MRAGVLFLALLFAVDDWEIARPDYEWSFPRDHWAHQGYRTEWWYFTGHLGERFSYQFTFFRIGVLRERPNLPSSWTAASLVMGHAALTDLETKRHLFSEVLYREVPLLGEYGVFPEPRIGWSRAPAGTDDVWTLDWNGEGFDFAAKDESEGFGFRLSTRPKKPLVFQGPGGFSRKGAGDGAASHYYSFTRIETAGIVELGEERFEVAGESWMDKEFSSSQLAERPGRLGLVQPETRRRTRPHALFHAIGERRSRLRQRDVWSTRRDEPTYLDRSAFEVEVLEYWTSPVTSARYPSKWRIRAVGLDLRVSSAVPDQENRSRLPRGVFYWEGAVAVEGADGRPMGRGFVEMTGYGEGNRPPV